MAAHCRPSLQRSLLPPTNRPGQPPVPGPGLAWPGRPPGREAGLPSCPPRIIPDARADPHRCGELRRGPQPGQGTHKAAERGGAGITARTRSARPQVRLGHNRRRLAGLREPLGTAATSPGRRAGISPSASTPKVVPLCSPAAKVRLHLCPSAAALFLPAPWPRSCLSAQAGPAGAGPRPFVLPECTSFSSAGNKNGEGLRWSRAVCEAALTPPPLPFLRCAAGSVLGGVPLRTEGPAAPGRRGGGS